MTAPGQCPEGISWCVTDHGRYEGHWGPKTIIGPFRGRPSDEIAVRAAQPGGKQLVWVTSLMVGAEKSPGAWLDGETATGLAGLVEMLATATPAQHRELAKALRASAEAIAAEGPPQAPAAGNEGDPA